MRTVFSLLAAALFAVTIPATARAADPVAMVAGGGRADFLDTPHSVNTSGFTDFAAGLTVYSDGTAQGHFECSIPAIVSISGRVDGGWVNDDGSVTIYGVAHGYDATIPGPFTGLGFMVTFYAGGPGVGGFDYVDDSGFFGPGQYDSELVRRGMIAIFD